MKNTTAQTPKKYLWYVGHSHILNAPCGGCPHGYAPSLETAIDRAQSALRQDHAAPDLIRHDVGSVRLDGRQVAECHS